MAKGRYLVTGGAGFIGSHLCDFVMKEGFEVLAIDSLITGRMENIQGLVKKPGFEFRKQDLSQGLKVEGDLAGIFHMASPASPVDYVKLPIETLRTGSMATDHVLALAVEKKAPVLVASTSEIYGDPLQHPQTESYWGNVNPIGIRSCYDEAKRYLEALTMAYHRVHKIQSVIIRIFNTYGPRMRVDDGRVVPNFCAQAIRGEDLTVYGEGKQTRSFCYVDDLVRGLWAALQSRDPQPFNLGNPHEVPILEFAKIIIELSGKKLSIKSRPMPEDDPKRRCPNIERAQKVLGWKPQVNLAEGLKTTYKYFEDTLA